MLKTPQKLSLRFFQITSVTGSAVLLVLLFPTALWSLLMSPATFFRQPVYSQKSPDKKYEIKVSRKVNFPADECLDPAITVYVSLDDAETNELINSAEFALREFSDLETPEIIWTTPGEVKINRIDSEEKISVRFPLPVN